MDFYTVVLRKSGNYWVALCLENGIVGQGTSKDDSIQNLKEAIDSFDEARKSDSEEDIYSSPISINELHEFLMVEDVEPRSQLYELRAISA
ncbi:MAG: type II toxin-antitoxin system HicB family antitoxin [Candidatus Aminicenantes bacterium]|nr:MAG: type II toxin-antitoxin system HicB family antitoxin [Candidatus Aminicenantes bacterium]